ncbi:MAG: cation-translocating P-type ATPase [Phycisphaerales bacterium]
MWFNAVSTPAVHAPSHNFGPEEDQRSAKAHETGIERAIVLYLVCFVLVVITTIITRLQLAEPAVGAIPAMIGSIILTLGLARGALRELLEGSPRTNTLATLALLGAMALGKFEAAGYVAFILVIFDMGLRRTAWGARRAIEELVGLTPDTANRVGEDGAVNEVGIAQLAVGDIVRVRAGENLPVDGVVVSGTTTINQASLTGEALPVEAQAGTSVYAGTSNLTGLIDVRVTQLGDDTTIGKVASLIEEAEKSRTPRQLIIEIVARFFVPVAIVTALIVYAVTGDVERAMTVLVVAAPSALLISSPTAMMAAFAAAARLGVMIKQTNYLEAAADIDTLVLDKTGTITTGRFAVARLAPAEGVSGADLLSAAAQAEQHSTHPLARSIIETAKQARIELDASGDAEEVHGAGVRAQTSRGEVLAGRATWITEMNPGASEALAQVEAKIEGMTGVHVMQDGRYLGAVGLEDKLRYNAKPVIEKVRELGVRSVRVFTGDRFAVAKRVGITVGADEIEAECLPEEKHQLILELSRKGKRVMMVGDGINDGPSLAAADVGVAMGLAGSDIATNSAGVALMTDDIDRIPFLIEIARKTRAVVGQNIAASIVIAIIGLVLAATGNFTLIAAALYHFVGDIFVLANSFRLVRHGEDFAAHEAALQAGKPGDGGPSTSHRKSAQLAPATA